MHTVKTGFFAAGALLVAAHVMAQSPLNAAASMRDNLNSLAQAKKVVTVVLKNGDSYRAKIGTVGNEHVVLTEPYQKEVFDVLVPIDEITALEVRAREP